MLSSGTHFSNIDVLQFLCPPSSKISASLDNNYESSSLAQSSLLTFIQIIFSVCPLTLSTQFTSLSRSPIILPCRNNASCVPLIQNIQNIFLVPWNISCYHMLIKCEDIGNTLWYPVHLVLHVT